MARGVGDTPEFDQRGTTFARIVGARIDIGAVEQLGSPFLVDTLVDESDGNYAQGDLSLREAIELANAQPGTDTIEFATGLATLWGSTILLKNGELAITESLTINGPATGTLIVDASGNDPTPLEKQKDGTRVFNIFLAGGAGETDVFRTVDVAMSRLTLRGGDEDEDGGAIRAVGNLTLTNMQLAVNAARDGGAIWAAGNVTLVKSTFTANRAVRGGGMWTASGSLAADQSTFSGNTATNLGGAIGIGGGQVQIAASAFNKNTATRNGGAISGIDSIGTLENSSFAGNSATQANGGAIHWSGGNLTLRSSSFSSSFAGGDGGGVMIASPVIRTPSLAVIENTVFSSNSASRGGALAWDGSSTVVVINSAIYGNTARGSSLLPSEGGGLFGEGPLVLAHSTVTRNTVKANSNGSSGGGMRVSLARLTNSIVAGNIGAEERDASLIAGGRLSAEYSLIGFNQGSGLAEAPVAHPDANGNLIGGPTVDAIDPQLSSTLVPFASSPAVNAGNPTIARGGGGLSEFDARRAPFARVVGGRIDLGAYELQLRTDNFNADFNGDQRTDGADFLLWQQGVGGAGSKSDGDATGNGVVDGSDLAVWLTRLGPPPRIETQLVPVADPTATGAEDHGESALLPAMGTAEGTASVPALSRPSYRPPSEARAWDAVDDDWASSSPNHVKEVETLDQAFATLSYW